MPPCLTQRHFKMPAIEDSEVEFQHRLAAAEAEHAFRNPAAAIRKFGIGFIWDPHPSNEFASESRAMNYC